MYRMIAIDLDGTLLSPAGEVSARSKQAVQRVLSAGLLVCFATGRNWTESRVVLDAVDHFATAVFAGGAMIVDTRNNVVLHQMNMEPALARAVCGFMESAGYAAMALQDHCRAGVDYLVTAEVDMDAVAASWLGTLSTRMRLTPHLPTAAHADTVRVSAVGPKAAMQRLHVELASHFVERVMCQMIDVPGPDFAVLEVFDPAVNKWQGILKVAQRHGIVPAEIIAIGDDMNDIAMIKNAGLGVAMGNAKPAVRAIAKRIVGTNANEGLVDFLNELVDQKLVAPAI